MGLDPKGGRPLRSGVLRMMPLQPNWAAKVRMSSLGSRMLPAATRIRLAMG